jgi:type II secretory pathway component GspD/PulD (secretin)
MVSLNAARSGRFFVVGAWALVVVCGALASPAIAAPLQRLPDSGDRRPTSLRTAAFVTPRLGAGPRFRTAAKLTADAVRPAAAPSLSQAAAEPKASPAPIIVVPGPGGVMIAGQDPAAVADFARLLESMAETYVNGGPSITVFYLKNAKAGAVAETLQAILAGAVSSSSNPSSAARIDATRIVAESRLNALIVQSDPEVTDQIEEILKVLDRRGPPQPTEVPPKPRTIAVNNAPAQDVAAMLRQVYANRLTGSSGSGGGGASPMSQGAMPMPLQAMLGMSSDGMMSQGNARGGARGAAAGQADDAAKMSIGVNVRSNSLVIVAPDAMFHEVEDLVAQLDEAASSSGSQEVVRILATHGSNAEVVAQTLQAVMGGQLHVGQGTPTASAMGPAGQSRGGLGAGPTGGGRAGSGRAARGVGQSGPSPTQSGGGAATGFGGG